MGRPTLRKGSVESYRILLPRDPDATNLLHRLGPEFD